MVSWTKKAYVGRMGNKELVNFANDMRRENIYTGFKGHVNKEIAKRKSQGKLHKSAGVARPQSRRNSNPFSFGNFRLR